MNVLKLIEKVADPNINCLEDRCCRNVSPLTLTCLVDLVAQREASTLPCVVWGELNVERGAWRDDGRRRNVPTVFAQQICWLTVAIPYLNKIIPIDRVGKGDTDHSQGDITECTERIWGGLLFLVPILHPSGLVLWPYHPYLVLTPFPQH